MDRLPRISIITPSFNQAKYLEKTILSVLEQGYPDLEYIVIDGGSTDGSVEIIRKYADRLAYWCSEPDHGQSEAINKGFRRATGEIVAWINSDDIYAAGALEKAARHLAEHPGTGMVYGDCDLINEDGDVYARERSGPFDLGRYIRHNFIPQTTVFLRRSAIASDYLVDETLHYAMDYDLWLKISGGHRIDYLPFALARFRYHDTSKTMTQSYQFAFENFLILRAYADSRPNAWPLVEKKLARALSRIRGEPLLSLIRGIEADAGLSLLTDDDMRLLRQIMSGDKVPGESLRLANRKVSAVYRAYFGRHGPPAGKDADDPGLIFLRQTVAQAGDLYDVDPAKSRRLLRSLVSLRPGLLREKRTRKLVAKIAVTPSGNRLLAGMKARAIKAYIRLRIRLYRLL